jgi:signal transduction histidine kinase
MIKKILGSLFTKLLLVVVCSAVMLNLIFYCTFSHYAERAQIDVNKHKVLYLNYLHSEIGHPPDRKKAEYLSQRVGLTIEYISPDISWITGARKAPFPDNQLHYQKIADDMFIGSEDEYMAAKLVDGDSMLLLKFWPGTEEQKRLRSYGLFIILLVSLLMGCVFMIIRHFLKPVSLLSSAIEEVKKENFDHKINKQGHDELADLCKMFDSLTSQIAHSIKHKERLLTAISHELRTPLASLRIAAEMVNDESLRVDMADDIKQMNMLIDYLLESARLNNDVLCLESVDLNSVVADICRSYKSRSVRINLIPYPSPVEMEIDVPAIEHALKNLIDNALKYSDESDEPVKVELRLDEEYAVIKVTDKGIGIPEDELEFITEPFYRTDISRSKKTGGYGLGLDICKQIAEAHGGKLVFKSILHEGTEANLYIPLQS